MNTGIISARYAKALLAYAMEQGAEDAVYDSMKSLVCTLHEVKEFPVILRNPGLRPSERVDLICSVMEPLSVIRRFVRLVVKMERVEMLIFIAYEYISLYRERKGVYAVRLITASPLDDSARSTVERLLEQKEAKRIEVEYVVDESIIGGFRMEASSRRVDASVEGQLRRIRKEILKTNRKLV